MRVAAAGGEVLTALIKRNRSREESVMFPTEQQEEFLKPEIILPIQFDWMWRRSTQLTPERSLLLAMLEQAASDLSNFRFRPRRRAQRIYWDAYQWVMSNDRSHPFSFVNICEVLKLSPQALRSGMLGRPPRDLVKAA